MVTFRPLHVFDHVNFDGVLFYCMSVVERDLITGYWTDHQGKILSEEVMLSVDNETYSGWIDLGSDCFLLN